MDTVTAEYLKRCRQDEDLRDVMARSPIAEHFRVAYGNRFVSRPFFAARDVIDPLYGDLDALFGVITSLPERLFDGDLDRYCAAAGIDAKRSALIRRLRLGNQVRAGRADLYREASSFKLLEFNIGGMLGLTDVVEVRHALMRSESFVRFADEFELEFVDVMEKRATMLRHIAEPVAGDRDPVVALIEADGWLKVNLDFFKSMQATMEKYGIRLLLGELGQLTSNGKRLLLGNDELDVVLRYFDVEQIIDDPGAQQVYDAICTSHERGGVVLQTPLESYLYSDKATIGLLSDSKYRSAFTASEQDLIDRLVPWTRPLWSGSTDFHGETVDLVDLCKRKRDDLIVKPGAGYSGIGIVAGWETSAEEWSELLKSSLDGPFIVQQRIRPELESVVSPVTGGTEEVIAAWGIYVSGEGFAGGAMRAASPEGGAVINVGSNPNTAVTTLFTYGKRAHSWPVSAAPSGRENEK